MVIQEFGAIIGIEAEQGERQGLFDISDLLQDAGFAFSQTALFGPGGSDIDAVHGKSKHTRHRVSTMGYGIGLQKSRPGFIPLVGF